MTDEISRLMDDAGIKGGSPQDRIIGMLLERTEAIRELHESMRMEFRDLIDTHTEIKNMMIRVGDRLESHQREDVIAFGNLNQSNSSIVAKLDSLSVQIHGAATANLIQKAQFNAGWKVIVVLGSVAIFAWAVFTTFFNHRWGMQK